LIQAPDFIEAARVRGFLLYTGVPCSYLKPFINYVIDSPDTHYVGAANEGDAVAIGAGSELGGKPAVIMFQNSGLGNAVNPLSSLTYIFKIPVLLIITLRGEPGGLPDEPQHQLMGAMTTSLLEFLQIPWAYFPTEASEIDNSLDRATTFMATQGTPYALVMKKGTVATGSMSSSPIPHPPHRIAEDENWQPQYTRSEILQALCAQVGTKDVIIATTGYTGRELYALADRPNQLYMVGSMGCAASLGLGIALACPERRVIVIDGDGALLMRLGVLATIAYEQPANFLHIVLDNEQYESTGGQSMVFHSVDFCAIAAASGYASVTRTQEVGSIVAAHQLGPSFVHVKIKPGTRPNLPRPTVTPQQVAERMRHFLQSDEKRKRGKGVL
jgi:phosphonopyruvate decarboxylase